MLSPALRLLPEKRLFGQPENLKTSDQLCDGWLVGQQPTEHFVTLWQDGHPEAQKAVEKHRARAEGESRKSGVYM